MIHRTSTRVCGAHHTLWCVHGRVPPPAHLAYVPSRGAHQVSLEVRPGAAGGLACASVLQQVATTPFGVAPTCRSTRAQPSLHPLTL